MSESDNYQPKSEKNLEIPKEELKPILTDLEKDFDSAFEKSKELPLWQYVPGTSLDSFVPVYASETERWRVGRFRGILNLHRDVRTKEGVETENIELRNDRATYLSYSKLTPDKNDPNKKQESRTENTPLAVEMLKKLISELPQYKN